MSGESKKQCKNVDIRDLMNEIDAQLSRNLPYAMPEVEPLFPRLNLHYRSEAGIWFRNQIFWAVNVKTHGNDIGFILTTKDAENEMKNVLSYVKAALDSKSVNNPMIIAEECKRFIALIDWLKQNGCPIPAENDTDEDANADDENETPNMPIKEQLARQRAQMREVPQEKMVRPVENSTSSVLDDFAHDGNADANDDGVIHEVRVVSHDEPAANFVGKTLHVVPRFPKECYSDCV